MVIIMRESATPGEIQQIMEKLTELGFDIHRSTGAAQTVLGVVGDTKSLDIGDYECLPGVKEVIRITQPYKLVGRTFKQSNTLVTVGDVTFGGNAVAMIAGPCSVESRQQIRRCAREIRETGTKLLRGGAYKPRSSPYAFQGMGEEGLKLLREAADENGMWVVSEVLDRMDILPAMRYVDMIQVGARNMQNFALLKELGKIRKPILLKRGMSASILELLMSAEYIMAGGNHEVVLCERGIRTFETYTRNTMDISAIPVLQQLSHLPVVADPSHGIGIRDKVLPMARASVAAGADGLIIEVHYDPDKALSDGAQTLFVDQYRSLVQEVSRVAQAIDRTL
jgi:3-deoxy-7-phosphoheptulonate synthase